MRVLKWSLGVILAIVVVFAAVGMGLPRSVTVARSVEVAAPADQVFPHVNSLKAMAAWSPWLDRDPDVALTYTGPDAGVGARMSWQSEHPQVGNGAQEIVASDTNRQVTTALDFGDMGSAEAALVLEASGDGTEVTWTLVTDMGAGPVGRWMGLLMDGWVGADYEVGLSQLKALVEG